MTWDEWCESPGCALQPADHRKRECIDTWDDLPVEAKPKRGRFNGMMTESEMLRRRELQVALRAVKWCGGDCKAYIAIQRFYLPVIVPRYKCADCETRTARRREARFIAGK